MPLRVQALLKERFHLAVHREPRPMQAYVLVVAKGGPKLNPPPAGEAFHLHIQKGHIWTDGGGRMPMLATLLSNSFDRPVFDETGLTGAYKLDLKWTPEPSPGVAADVASGPSLFTALQEQLGLKLESAKRPVEMLVIDHVERPTEN